MLVEHFGPFDLYFDLIARPEGLRWDLVKWRFLKIPLPEQSLPVIDCVESGDGDRFVFDIDVAFPLVGPVIAYKGWLTSEESEGVAK